MAPADAGCEPRAHGAGDSGGGGRGSLRKVSYGPVRADFVRLRAARLRAASPVEANSPPSQARAFVTVGCGMLFP
ncbi:MAG: hypothetical protein OXU61_03780 [Gammaproteobacteria bacterium]|nr:hypothetical protein [Gammaproteobacteria bacterium]